MGVLNGVVRATQPAVFVNHGGGPLPLMGQQPSIAGKLRNYAKTLESKPRAIVLVDAHWEADSVTVSTAKQHTDLIFDYGGFPPETYQYVYKPPGEPAVAQRIVESLQAAKIPVKTDAKRGLDHGAFVPLMLMFPDADVPIVPLSIQHGQDAATHVQLGLALAELRHENVLIVGSGLSFHNMGYFFSRGKQRETGYTHGRAFDSWLRATITNADASPEKRMETLCAWQRAPSANECHPPGAAEHLMPLFVCAGVGRGLPPSRVDALTTYVGDDPNGKSFEVSQFEWR